MWEVDCNYIHVQRTSKTKTSVLPITRSKKAISLTPQFQTMQQIPIVECFKCISVTISKNLSWSQHITNTVRSSKLLHRKLNEASQQSKHTLSMGALCYRSLSTEPQYVIPINQHQLENTQSFACKITTKNGNLTIPLYLTNSSTAH